MEVRVESQLHTNRMPLVIGFNYNKVLDIVKFFRVQRSLMSSIHF